MGKSQNGVFLTKHAFCKAQNAIAVNASPSPFRFSLCDGASPQLGQVTSATNLCQRGFALGAERAHRRPSAWATLA